MRLSTGFRNAITTAIAVGCMVGITAVSGPASAATLRADTAKSGPAKLPLSAAQMRADARLRDVPSATATSGPAGLTATSGGSLTGLAQSAAGTPLTGICVTAFGPSGQKSAVTRQAGQFLITGLRPGRYQLQYRGCDPARPYLPEWYGGAFGRSQSATVTVSGLQVQSLHPVTMYALGAGQSEFPSFGFGQRDGPNDMAADPFGRRLPGPVSAAALNRSLASRLASSGQAKPAAAVSASRAGKISGRVASPAGKGLAGICVDAFPTGNSGSFGFVQTGKTGKYSVGRLAPGRYELIFFAQCGNGGNWLAQIYKNKDTFDNPTPVRVKAGQTAAGVNVVMRAGGEISGTVTGPLGKKLGNICVSPLPVSGVASTADGLPVFTAVSHDGVYHVRGVPAGSYQLGFSPCGSADYSPTLWPGTQNFGAAATIKMRSRDIVGNIDEVMQLGGIIQGTVTSAADPSTKLSGMCVSVEENDGLGTFGFTASDADGGYIIKGLSPGHYQVSVQTGCNNNGNFVGVNYPSNVSIDYGQDQKGIDLAMPAGAIISGTVTSAATAKPVAGICVQISGNEGFAQTQTAANGSYSADQLPADTYQVQFFGGCGNSGSYAPQGYNDTNVLFPQNLTATTGQVITGIDAAMQPGPAIAGKVTDTAGHKLNGICVFGISPGGVEYGGAATAGGRYDMTDLAPGPYQVVFTPGCNNNADLATQWFKSQGTEATAALVSANSGTVHGIDGVLAPASGISGVLKSKGGRKLEGGCVDLTGVSGAARSQFAQVFTFGSQYEITGMPLGAYQVVFQPNCFGGGYENQWYKDSPGPAHATNVKVVAGHIHSHIDSAVIVGGTISGRITSGGEPVHDMCVFAQNITEQDDNNVALSTVQGRYVIRGLNSGNYELEVAPCSNKTAALAVEILPHLVHVTAPKQTTGVNISVAVGGSVAGSVSGGSPVTVQPGVCVLALQVNGVNGSLADTAPDGTYTVTNLPAGQYQIFFGDPGCGVGAPDLAPQWYPDAQTEITAGSVSVTAGGTTQVAPTTLSTDGSITGVVTGPGSIPLAGVCVSATPPGAGQTPEYSVTGSKGTYQLADLAPGQYRVEFSSGCGAAGYLTQWWQGAASRQKATLVDVTTGTATTGISAALHK